jgi:adenosylcobinamide-GDP ribazoletransferase
MTSLRAALAMFTIAPVPASWHAASLAHVRGTVRWLPALGAALGALAGLVTTGVLARSTHAGLLGAALSVAVLALLTRGLHLDGLADTADGLGSRAAPERALDIMKQSDIGPFGVVSLVMVVLVDVVALATAADAHGWRAPAALAVAAATGRLAVVHAALPAAAPARPGGFGALVTGTVRPAEAIALTLVVLGGAAGLAAAVDASIAGWVLGQVGALVVAAGLRAHCSRRFGGVTGDVFGALIEVTSAATLVGLALA